MSDHILEMRDITKTFPGVKALSNVTLAVDRGEIHAICGENGAGKSTLMKVLSGVYPAGSYEGEIYFDGEGDVREGLDPRERLRDAPHLQDVVGHASRSSRSWAGRPR